MACDYEFRTRLEFLADLMEIGPDKPMRKLQREALKYYPVSSQELTRFWLSRRVAFLAADIVNARL